MNIRALYRRGRSYRFSHSLQAAARNTGVTVAGRAASMTATVVFTALFSRHVGVEGFGQYAYALSLATLLGGLCGFGLDSLAIRELVRFPQESARIIGRSLFLQLLLSVLCLGGLTIFFTFIHRDLTLLAVSLIVGAYTFLDVSGLLVISVFRAREVMRYEAAAVVIGNVALIVLTIAGIALHLGIRGVLALVAASYVIKFVVVVWYARTRCGVGSLAPELRPSTHPLRAGLPFFVSSAGNTLYGSYPRLMLAAFVAIPVVGLYAAAERIIALVAVVTGILDIVIYPIFARRLESSREAFVRTYQQVTDFTLVIGLVIGLGVACLLPEIIRILFGSAYAEAVPIGILLVPSVAMSTLGYVSARAMFVLHHEKMMSIATACTALAGIVISFVLVPVYGAKGMALTALVTGAFGYFYFIYLRVKLDLPWITPRHVTFFAVFPIAFVITFLVQGAGLLQRLVVNGSMVVVLVLLFRMIGMLDWLSVFNESAELQEAPPAAA